MAGLSILSLPRSPTANSISSALETVNFATRRDEIIFKLEPHLLKIVSLDNLEHEVKDHILIKDRRTKQAPEESQARTRLAGIQPSEELQAADVYAREAVRGYPEQPLEPQIHDEFGRKAMRTSCRLAAQNSTEKTVTNVCASEQPGVTTDYIDKQVHKLIMNSGAFPSPLRYARFPKSICTSVNDVICHGIPDSRRLEDGDIINIDITVFRSGFHGDTSKTFLCGNVDDELKQLVEVTRECLTMAISICGPGVEYKRIGETIHEIADRYKYGVIRDFIGHGIGRFFHSAPAIIHCRNRIPGRMQVGETFTIGTDYEIWNDGWTAVTKDGSYTAQFEHTVLIHETGVEILTLPM